MESSATPVSEAAPLPPEVPAVPVAEEPLRGASFDEVIRDESTATVDTSAAEAQAAVEVPAPDNVVQLNPPTLSTTTENTQAPAAPEKTLEQQIADAEAVVAALEAQRERTAVSELQLDPDALSLVSKQRAEQRYPSAWKAVEKHLKQIAWSGETTAYLEPTTPIFNDRLIKDLTALNFKAKLISLGVNQGFKIEVKWGRK